MARRHLIRTTQFPYHVTARVNNREHFPCDIQTTWRIFSKNLNKINECYQAQLHAFVLMPNHYHLLLTTPQEDLGVTMQLLQQSVTKTINLNCRRTGRVFGARYHWSVIDTQSYFDYVVKYIYRNPVKANLAKCVLSYEYSSLQGLLSNKKIGFELNPAFNESGLIPNNDECNFLSWLNQPFNSEQDKAIKKALSKREFFIKSGWTRSKKVLNYDAPSIKK